MKLRTWFYLLTAPSLLLLAALLASTIWSTHRFAVTLQALQQDDESAVAVDRYLLATDRELKEFGAVIASLASSPRSAAATPDAHVAHLEAAKRDADEAAAFMRLTLGRDGTPGPGDPAWGEASGCATSSGATSLRLRSLGDSAVRLATAGKIGAAKRLFNRVDVFVNDSIEAACESRMQVEEQELEAGIQALATRDNILGAFLLGATGRTELSRAPIDLGRLEKGLTYGQAFNGVVNDFSEAMAGVTAAYESDRRAEEADGEGAINGLIASYHDDSVPADLVQSRTELAHTIVLGARINALAISHPSQAAALVGDSVDAPFHDVIGPRLDRVVDGYRAALFGELAHLRSRTGVLNGAMVALTLLVLVAAIGGPWLITRGVITPIAELTTAAIRIGWGDFNAPLAKRGVGELAQLQTEFESMAARLKELTDGFQASEHAQRAAREAAEAASRAKSDFLANMSHEIRTPMNGVMGMLDLALDRELPPEQRDYLETARSSAEALLSIINDILDFSKIEAGKMELDAAAFLLSENLSDTLSVLALRAHKKGLELGLHVGPDVPEGVIGDAGRLRQIVTNLVGNAIKFTDHGEVVVQVDVEGQTQDHLMLHFRVRDTGVGIPADKQAAIFEAFQQADTSTTRQFGGTGLGLSITTRLVSLMGGRVWVESEVGQGSTFHFTARFVVAEPGSVPATFVRRDLRGLSVLVVDDNATNRAIMQGFLARWDMHATLVESGPAALELLRRESAAGRRFQLLIVDAQMPGMDGFTLVENVRRMEGYGEPAIMMLSSCTFHDDVKRCRDVGIDLYLSKPVRGSELLDAIGRVVGRAEMNAEHRAAIVRTAPRAVAVEPDANRLVHVLVAEDNAVNLKLTVALLERHGAKVTVATNGREAVEAWGRDRFDAILMDLQMPELDGLAATREIRRRETLAKVHARIPIVALTARAMSDDRARCFEAGMDGYVTKPVRAPELFATLNQVIVTHEAPAPAPAAAPTQASAPIFDLDALREMAGGDETLVTEVVDLFTSDSRRLAAEVRAAIDVDDRVALRTAAHTLKGAAGSFSALRVAAVARTLEGCATTATPDALLPLGDDLDAELDALHRRLADLGLSPADQPALALQ